MKISYQKIVERWGEWKWAMNLKLISENDREWDKLKWRSKKKNEDLWGGIIREMSKSLEDREKKGEHT